MEELTNKEEAVGTIRARPFEQQPRESAKAFAAFRAYLDLGAERSLLLTAEKVGKSKRMMEKWSAKFDWPARVQAQAAHLAELERKAIESVAVEKAVEWDKTHEPTRRLAWQQADELIALAGQFLERWRVSSRAPGFESIVRGIELAFKLKQFAASMPSEIKEVNTHVSGSIDVDWEIAIRKAYAQVAPVGDQTTPPATSVTAPVTMRPNDSAVVEVEALPNKEAKDE